MPQKYDLNKLVKRILLILKYLTILFVTSQTPNCSHCVVRNVSHDQKVEYFKGL